VNDCVKYGSVIESLTFVSEIICRYALVERLYLIPISPASEELQRSLVVLYAAVLTLLSHAAKYFRQNTASKS
jgi:hypothetical protein